MYLDYFGLKRPPFKITPDSSMFYDGGARGNALDALIYAILNGEGIVKVVGEVGSGKTMLCRMLELKLPPEVEIVYIANPNITPEHILHTIAIELEIGVDESSSRLEVMQKLQHFLLERHKNGYQIVVFVEEAQGMPIETLEEIRLMSNLETDQDKLLQIVLFGQPELDENLKQPDIRQLKERITHSFFLNPFTPEEVHKYLNFRMTIAGYHGPDIFSPKISQLICKETGGLLRRINIVADKVLLSAFAQETHNIDKKHVTAAVNDCEFNTIHPQKKQRYKLAFSGLAASLCLLLALIAAKLIDLNQENTNKTEQITKKLIATPQSSISNINETNQIPNTLEPSTDSNKKILKIEEDRQIITNESAEKIAISAILETPKKPNNSQNQKLLSNLEIRINATKNWLINNSPDIYTIQLMSIKEQHINHLHKYLGNLSDTNLFQDIYIYQTEKNDEKLFGVLYNNFLSKRDAYAALSALPTILNANSPVLRTIRGINGEISKSYGRSNL